MQAVKLVQKWQEEKRIYEIGHKYDQQGKQPRRTVQCSNSADFLRCARVVLFKQDKSMTEVQTLIKNWQGYMNQKQK